ncbi:iron chelate uptake ABC transporter family permease subunit [Streptomyces otsuchiensis]|uniref:iron chelate uptake ABC transporter family permease subunit n=1 Tax=Streptomyces otsuchiensis TaxID=2681388 RepID=UPI003F68B2AB
MLGILVGAALAVSGALMQGLTRNPLGSPDIIGFSGRAPVAPAARPSAEHGRHRRRASGGAAGTSA